MLPSVGGKLIPFFHESKLLGIKVSFSSIVFLFVSVKQIKMDFFELLANHHLDSQSRWSKVKDKVETDPRYKAVDSSSQREDLFKQYIEKIAKVCVWHLGV